MIRTTTRQYYLISGLFACAIGFIAATYVTFLITKGLNLFEVNIVNLAFFTTLFLCEIPTGAFADVFGRKTSVITACILLAIGMFMYAQSETLGGFIAAEMVSAVGKTFSSGAFTAWFVDRLRHHGHTDKLNHIFARAQQIKQVVGLTSAIAGAFLASVSLSLPWVMGGIAFLITAIVAWRIEEEYFVPQKFSFKNGLRAMKETVRSSFVYGAHNVNVRFVLVLVTIQIFAIQAPNMQWQPLFTKELTHTSYLGFVWTAISLSILLGAWLAPRILKRFKDERKALIACQIAIGLGFGLVIISGYLPLTLFLFLAHEVARGAFLPIKDAYLHDNIPSKERATIESFESLAHHGGGTVGLLVSGWLALKLGIPYTWMILGTTLILVTVLVTKKR